MGEKIGAWIAHSLKCFLGKYGKLSVRESEVAEVNKVNTTPSSRAKSRDPLMSGTKNGKQRKNTLSHHHAL